LKILQIWHTHMSHVGATIHPPTKAAKLLQILALRMIACQSSPLTTFHVEGERNQMADFASRSFTDFPESTNFLTEFHRKFPLPQNAFWIEYHFPKKIIGRVL